MMVHWKMCYSYGISVNRRRFYTAVVQQVSIAGRHYTPHLCWSGEVHCPSVSPSVTFVYCIESCVFSFKYHFSSSYRYRFGGIFVLVLTFLSVNQIGKGLYHYRNYGQDVYKSVLQYVCL